MSEKEHPARTAGKYVRAAGIAIKKERERLASESAAKRAAEAARAEQQPAPPPAQAPAPARAPTAAAAPAAAPPAQPARAGRQPAPAPPPNRFLDRLCWYLFLLAIVSSVLVFLSIETVTSGTPKMVLRLVLGGICFAFSIALLANWQHTKERVLATLTQKLWGLGHPVTRMGRFMRAIAKDVLTLLGIAWLAIGVLEILRVITE